MSGKFLDIFSNKKEKVKVHETITVDYREKNSLVISELVSNGVEVEMRELKVGDYIVNETAVERKTVSDFISSMINKRLFRQLEELQQYKQKLLIIEGVEEQELYNDRPEGISGNAIRGFILSILLKFRVPIIFSKDYKDTAKFLLVLLRKSEKGYSLNAKKKSFDKKEQVQFILEGFPGIGPKTAKKLLREYKTLLGVFNAPIDDLRKLIGKKADVFSLLSENFD